MTTADVQTPNDRFARWDGLLTALLLGAPAAVLLAAALAPNGATRIYTWPWAFYVQGALLAPWLGCAWSFARGRRGSAAGWWFAAPLLLVLAMSLLASDHRRDAFEAALVLATPLVLLPFVAQAWSDATPRGRLLATRTLAAALGVLTVAAVTTWLMQAPGTSNVFRWMLASRNPHTLGHWNYTGGLALLALPVTVLLAWRERGVLRLAWAIVAGAAVVQLISSGSRGAVLGLVCAAAASLVLLALRGAHARRRLVIAAAILAVVCAAVVATNPRLRQGLSDPASLVSVGESEQQRMGFLLTGMRLVQARPWLGFGPGTTPYHYPEFRVDRPGSLENSFQLHCGPLQWWVDTGSIGLIALLAVVGVVLVRTWRIRRSLTGEALAATALLAGYGAMWLTDYQLDVPIYPLVLALAGAVLVAEMSPPSAPTSRSGPAPWLGPALLAAFPIVSVLVLLPSWRARSEFSAAWAAKDENHVDRFLKHLRAAADLAPWQPYYANHLARALAGIAEHLPPETATALRAEAATSWRRSLAVSPHQDHPWLNLGWLALKDGAAHQAAACFEAAAAIYPRRTGVWLGLALAQVQQNDPARAADALVQEIRLNPAFITSPWWNEAPLADLRPRVLASLARGRAVTPEQPTPSPGSALAAFAAWWWNDQVNAPDAATPPASPALVFLADVTRLNDRSIASVELRLSTPLQALRESWRTQSPVRAAPGLTADLIAGWEGLVRALPERPFTTLLRTYPGTALRRVHRPADGILFRQTDGDPLTDLTEYPLPAHIGVLAPLLPPPSMAQRSPRPGPGAR